MLKLEKQVCDVDLGKRLKELDVKQDSIFFWIPMNKSKYRLSRPQSWYGHCKHTYVSAFTVAELGLLLPDYIDGKFLTIMRDDNGKWQLSYDFISTGDHTDSFYPTEDSSEANARAKMLINLIENKLMEVKK